MSIVRRTDCVPLPMVVCPVVAVVTLESRVASCVHCVENVACFENYLKFEKDGGTQTQTHTHTHTQSIVKSRVDFFLTITFVKKLQLQTTKPLICRFPENCFTKSFKHFTVYKHRIFINNLTTSIRMRELSSSVLLRSE